MFEVKEAKGHKLYEIWRDLSRPEAERTQALRDMESLYKGIMDRLPPEWKTVQDQAPAGNSAPRASTTDLNTSRATSGDPSSPRTSDGTIADQALSDPSSNIEPGSGSTAGVDRSTRKNLMEDTFKPDINTANDGVNSGAKGSSASEATPAGEQTLMAGVDPITERQQLEARQAQPLEAQGRGSDTQIGGLFDPQDPRRVWRKYRPIIELEFATN